MREALSRKVPRFAFVAVLVAMALAAAACSTSPTPAAVHKPGKGPVTIGGPTPDTLTASTTTPPAIPKADTSGAGGYANAKQQWVAGASEPSYKQTGTFRQAASDLTAVLAQGGGDPTTYSEAVDDLYTLSALPETGETPQQQQQATSDVAALNSFFGTPGLYG